MFAIFLSPILPTNYDISNFNPVADGTYCQTSFKHCYTAQHTLLYIVIHQHMASKLEAGAFDTHAILGPELLTHYQILGPSAVSSGECYGVDGSDGFSVFGSNGTIGGFLGELSGSRGGGVEGVEPQPNLNEFMIQKC